MTELSRCPLIREIDLALLPLDAIEFFKNRRFCFFLDSGMDPQKLGRYSFLGSDPFLVISTRGREVSIDRRDHHCHFQGNPFDVLEHYLKVYRLDAGPSSVPFIGGAVGYLSYDLCHFIEQLPSTAVDDLELP